MEEALAQLPRNSLAPTPLTEVIGLELSETGCNEVLSVFRSFWNLPFCGQPCGLPEESKISVEEVQISRV